ncbi:hypothetical protein [Pseudarthrobacter sulfonivorans]|uniref:hypothetical protein n=1 Tax=Pseudarthrobacter sulfonivorans TaxID=121292 RepID=UPI00285FA981|nr:hypothetical protein [Pseudarthrobacter sulfonivorans]MDR6413319.1 hypothetical protein [Pseudarthrobacter sulfonivorans]
MANTIFDVVKTLLPGAADRIIFPQEIRLLLEHLSTDAPLPASPGHPPMEGEVKASANDSAGGFARLDIAPLGPAIPFHLRLTGPAEAPTGFQFDLEPASGLLKLPAACRPGKVQVDAAGKRTLVEDPTAVRVAVTLNGADPLAIRIEGQAGSSARQGIVALDTAQSGMMGAGINPPAFLVGGQGFGIHLPGGLTVDSSAALAPPPVEHGDGRPLPSEAAPWQGVALRKAELFLPASTPLIGAGPIPVEVDLGLPRGLYGHSEVKIPAEGSRPAFDVDITWDDPGATSLASALPTAIEIRTMWNLDQTAGPPGVGTVALLGGRPLKVTGRFTRVPGTTDLEFGLIVEAGGDQGLLTVEGDSTGGKVIVTAAALATAFIADAEEPTQPGYDGFGATLHALLVAAAGLSAFLDDGSVTLHAVEIDAGLAAAGTRLTLRVDYSVDVLVRPIGLGFMSIGMKPNIPMRLRYRNVRMLVDFAQSGMDRFHLSFGEADIGVEDPGGWKIDSPGTVSDLFDVLGSRSGHGSQWFEIDLRFALDLGPVSVNGATVRVTLGPGGALRPELRGLDASLTMPGLFEARGKASLAESRLDLALAAKILPLNVGGFARLSYEDCGQGVNKLVFALGVDLPGPIPLANSGLGLYGLGGIFGVNAQLPIAPPGQDPVEFQFTIDPLNPSKYACAPGGSVFGLGAVVGTAPDLGWTFSARAVIVIGIPDVSLRASLDGKVLAKRVEMGNFGTPPAPGLSFLGLLAVAPDGVTIAVRGHYEIPVLFTIDVPFGAHFPSKGPSRDWYVRLGSDGALDRTSPGPIQARILPGILDVGAWAYLMVQGNGIPSLGGDPAMSLAGFAIGFGAGFTATYGNPLVGLDLSASAIIGIGTNPFFLAGKGHLSGSLHLGPVSIGASAEIMLQVGPALEDAWVKFKVCGEVDLFFFSLEGCVEIQIGEKSDAIPAPTEWPLASVALSDHRYTKVAGALRADGIPSGASIPIVWPDVIPILQFTTGPANALAAGPFTDKLVWDASAVGDGVVGNERLSYTYTLDSVELTAMNPDTLGETAVAGPLEAAWQANKAGQTGQPGARELALLTWETTLWTRKLVDGGVDDPHDPLPAVARRCREVHAARPGWALGALGRRHGPGEGWRLPTEAAPGPFASSFEVRVAARWWEKLIDESTLALLPHQFPLQLGGPAAFAAPLGTMARDFTGGFRLPHVVGFPRDVQDPDGTSVIGEVPITVTLTFDRPLHDPFLALLLPKWPPDYADRRLHVYLIGQNGSSGFPPQGDEDGIGDDFVRTYAESGGPYLGVRLSYSAALAVVVLGIRGVTETASLAAAGATAAAQAAAQTAAAKATAVTPRKMLAPNTIYRIDVTVSGEGKRAESGTTAAPVVHTDRYWFRTPKMSGPAPSAGLQYPQTTAAVAKLHYDRYVASPAKMLRTDQFDPAYLERYVLSWMPADKARYWFLKDAVGVQMEVNHVPDLAAAYDHDTKLRVRRTDPTKGKPDPFEIQEFPASSIWQAAVSALQAQADIRLHGLTSVAGACRYPPPGATLGGRPELQPLSQYDLFLAFPFLDTGAGGLTGGAEIPGVVFSTSRYNRPEDLLANMGFGNAPDPGLHGDMEVGRVPVNAGDTASDGAVQQALTRLGLGRRPVAGEPRSTGLWCRAGDGWALHGVLLEAPEPIHRPDTLGLANFGGRVLVRSLASSGRTFEQVIRSASGDRLLFLTGAPFTPAGTLGLTVTLQQVPLESATAPATSTLSCPIAAAPGFVEDLA